jgi:hypothetical protein
MVLVCWSSVCVHVAGAEGKLTISRVSVSNRSLSPTEPGDARVRYYLSEPARVMLEVYDREEKPVRGLEKVDSEGPGYSQTTWDGLDDAKKAVEPGVYFFRVVGIDAAMADTVVHEAAGTRGWDLNVSKLKWDEKGVISYELPEAAEVSARIGIKGGGPLLRTLLYQEPQDVGRQKINWDGWDNSRVVSLLGRDDLLVSVQAKSLGSNAIIVEGKSKTPRPLEPVFDFEITNAKGSTDSGLPVARDELWVEVSIAREHLKRMQQLGFEVMFFMDFMFLYEEEQPGKGTYVHKWDISGLPEGEHILTVNILDPDDRATASKSKIIHVVK